DNILEPLPRNVVEQVRGKVPVWINYTDALPGADVLNNEVMEKRCLASAAFPDRVEVLAPVALLQNEWGLLSPFFTQSQNKVPFVHCSPKRASTPNALAGACFSANAKLATSV